MKQLIFVVILVLLVLLAGVIFRDQIAELTICVSKRIDKPVIYLYPTEPTEVTVRLDFDGELTCTWPEYRDGWRVTAHPDGTIEADGSTFGYLFWEGKSRQNFDMTQGFCVAGKDTAAFLTEALGALGLTSREANEFIAFWLPRMQENPWNLIAFQTDAYEASAGLTVTPAPDSMLRVFMTYKALAKPVEIPPQTLAPFVREGFAVVEWGGCKVK